MKADDDALPLLRGTLDMLVLRALSGGPMHGFAIALWLEERSDGQIGLDDSVAYQVLHRLEGRELIEAEWKITPNNRRARVYRLTRAGRARLAADTNTWLRYTKTVTAIMTTNPRPATE